MRPRPAARWEFEPTDVKHTFAPLRSQNFSQKSSTFFFGGWRSAPKHFFANEYWISVFPHLLCRILHFFRDFFSEICPDFATNSWKEWRVSLFQSNLRKQIRKLPKILKIIHYYSLFLIIIHSCPYCRSGTCRKQVGSPASPDTPETSDTQTTAPQVRLPGEPGSSQRTPGVEIGCILLLKMRCTIRDLIFFS